MSIWSQKRCLNSLKNCSSQCICRSKNRGRCLHSCRTYYINAGHEEVACWWPREGRVLMVARNRMPTTNDRVLMAVTKRPRAYKTCRAFSDHMRSLDWWAAERKPRVWWPRGTVCRPRRAACWPGRGRLIDGSHEGTACLQTCRAFSKLLDKC
jgi:hypothetical protein